MAQKKDTTLTGAAGEHLVISRLLQRDIVAAQAPEGVKKVDILVNFLEDGSTPCFIQVKSRTYGSDGGWHVHAKHEAIKDPNLFYAFVDFEPKEPQVYIVPARTVAEIVARAHQIWLDTPGAKGQPHNDGTFRKIGPKSAGTEPGWMNQYLENWDLISRH